VDFERV